MTISKRPSEGTEITEYGNNDIVPVTDSATPAKIAFMKLDNLGRNALSKGLPAKLSSVSFAQGVADEEAGELIKVQMEDGFGVNQYFRIMANIGEFIPTVSYYISFGRDVDGEPVYSNGLIFSPENNEISTEDCQFRAETLITNTYIRIGYYADDITNTPQEGMLRQNIIDSGIPFLEYYNGERWIELTKEGTVQSVNSKDPDGTGNVTLTADDISNGTTNKYFSSTDKTQLDTATANIGALATEVEGIETALEALNADNVAETASKKWMLDTERTKLAGITPGATAYTDAAARAAVGKTNNSVGFTLAGGTTSKAITLTTDVTLSQDLQTTSAIQFSRIGLGTAADSTYPLKMTGGTANFMRWYADASNFKLQTANNSSFTNSGGNKSADVFTLYPDSGIALFPNSISIKNKGSGNYPVSFGDVYANNKIAFYEQVSDGKYFYGYGADNLTSTTGGFGIWGGTGNALPVYANASLFAVRDLNGVLLRLPQATTVTDGYLSDGQGYLWYDTGVSKPKLRIKNGAAVTEFTLGNSGTGDVVGPASSTSNNVAMFTGTTGKLLAASSINCTTSGSLTVFNTTTPNDKITVGVGSGIAEISASKNNAGSPQAAPIFLNKDGSFVGIRLMTGQTASTIAGLLYDGTYTIVLNESSQAVLCIKDGTGKTLVLGTPA